MNKKGSRVGAFLVVNVPEKTNSPVIFIVGRPRSGTNFIRSILNRHPDIWISAEPDFFNSRGKPGVFGMISPLFPVDSDSKIEKIFSLLGSGTVKARYWTNPKLDLDKIKSGFAGSDRDLRDLMRITLQERARSEGRSRFGDKTPSNLHRLKILAEWFPGAKFLHIVRDPRAVFTSEINRRSQRHYHIRKINVFTRFLIFLHICRDWRRNIHLLKRYRKQYPENYLFIRFRLLYTELEDEVRRICDFIQVDFKGSMLNPDRRGSNFSDDHDPLDGWKDKIPRFYDFLFRLVLGRKIRLYT